MRPRRRLLVTLALVAALAVAGAGAAGPARGQPGGTSVCHFTGSVTQPYVLLTVPTSALEEHLGHPDDVIPAPAGGCPAERVPGGSKPPPPTVEICHADEGRYVALTVPESELPTHRGHRFDVIPAPAEGCPATVQEPDGEQPEPPPGPPDAPPTPPGGEVEGAPGVPTLPPEATGPGQAGRVLARTGGETTAIAATGLGLLLMGAGLRLLAAPAGGVRHLRPSRAS